jgi:hypothetical protein
LSAQSKVATAFDSGVGGSMEHCRELAKAKLVEATPGVASSLVKT